MLKDELKDELSFLLPGGTFIVATNWGSFFKLVCSGTIRIPYLVNVLFLNVTFILISGHKYEHPWTQSGQDMVEKKVELTVRNTNRQWINIW